MNRSNEEWEELRRRRELEEKTFCVLRETTKRLEETAKDARGAGSSGVGETAGVNDFGAEIGGASEEKKTNARKERERF